MELLSMVSYYRLPSLTLVPAALPRMSAREQANALKAQGSKPIHKTFMAISLSPQKTPALPRLALPAASSIVSKHRRIKYVPCRIEAVKRQIDTLAFAGGDYLNYGSSNGSWRSFAVQGKTIILPDNQNPRRSIRIQNRGNRI